MRMRLAAVRGRGLIGLLALGGLLAGMGRTIADDGSQPEAVLAGVVVDAAGKPVADAEVDGVSGTDVRGVRTDTAGVFRLSVPMNVPGQPSVLLIAREGGRLGVLNRSGWGPVPTEPPRVVLKSGRALEVRVVNREGRPVEAAEVHFLLSMRQVVEGRTDAAGSWITTVPAESEGWSVYALRSKAGFDYAEGKRAASSAEPPRPLPDRLTLTLDGARPPLRVKAVDPQGKPLPNILLGPWIIQKPGHETQMNGMRDAYQKTDADGVAIFDWLPERIEGRLSIRVSSDDYYHPDNASRAPADGDIGELLMTLHPVERLAGRVTTSDGRSASGATILVEGQGGGVNTFRQSVKADADGRYALKVNSDFAYILTASKDDLAAPCRSDVVVRAGKPVENVDLILGQGTRVRGRVTLGKDQPPTEPIYFSARIEAGRVPDDLKDPRRPEAPALSMHFHTASDADGRYDLLLGPGEYRLGGPARVEPFKFTIPATDPPLEIVHDFEMPRADFGKLAVTVVDGEGRPVAGALLEGRYPSLRENFSPQRTNEKGTSLVRRRLDPLILAASTPDRSRGAVASLDVQATEVRFVLRPVATAAGKLLDTKGKTIADRNIQFGVRPLLSSELGGATGQYFGGATRTDSEGRFQLAGIIVGETYEITWHNNTDRRDYSAEIKMPANEPNALVLGDVAVRRVLPKPRAPLLPDQINRVTAFEFTDRKGGTPQETLAYVLTEARRDDTRPLLLFGKVEDPACRELFRLFHSRTSDDVETRVDLTKRKTPHDLLWEFERAALDVTQAEVKAFASELGVMVGEGKPPVLVVLSDEGKPIGSNPLVLGPDKKLDSHALGAFMLAWKRPTRDAEAMLSEGLARARAEEKLVFLDFGASWCGPCRLLGQFLEANKSEMDRHYVLVKFDIDRDTHARSIMERYEGEAPANGIPWYMIVDHDGKPLITSNAKKPAGDDSPTNIAFPSSKSNVDHFITMLKQTAPRMTAETLAGLRRQLEKKP